MLKLVVFQILIALTLIRPAVATDYNGELRLQPAGKYKFDKDKEDLSVTLTVNVAVRTTDPRLSIFIGFYKITLTLPMAYSKKEHVEGARNLALEVFHSFQDGGYDFSALNMFGEDLHVTPITPYSGLSPGLNAFVAQFKNNATSLRDKTPLRLNLDEKSSEVLELTLAPEGEKAVSVARKSNSRWQLIDLMVDPEVDAKHFEAEEYFDAALEMTSTLRKHGRQATTAKKIYSEAKTIAAKLEEIQLLAYEYEHMRGLELELKVANNSLKDALAKNDDKKREDAQQKITQVKKEIVEHRAKHNLDGYWYKPENNNQLEDLVKAFKVLRENALPGFCSGELGDGTVVESAAE